MDTGRVAWSIAFPRNDEVSVALHRDRRVLLFAARRVVCDDVSAQFRTIGCEPLEVDVLWNVCHRGLRPCDDKVALSVRRHTRPQLVVVGGCVDR